MYADRVKDSTTTTGTGTLTISGSAPAGFQAWNTAVPTGTKVPYTVSSSGGSEWEVGIGTLVTATTISRDQVLASSNANALVSFSAGSKDVYLSLPAESIADIGLAAAFSMHAVRN